MAKQISGPSNNSTSDTGQFLPPLAVLQPWQLRVTADDDALLPVINRGDAMVVDCSERALIDGEIYAVRHDATLRFWLYCHGFDGVGHQVGGIEIGTLTSLAGSFRCEAALDRQDIQIVGRCVGRLDSDDSSDDPLVRLANERRAVLLARDRLLHSDSAPRMADAPLPRDAESRDPASLRGWIARSMKNESFARFFRNDQRLNALTARLMHIEDVMSRHTATSLAGIKSQLDMLWDVHYEPFPEDMDDLGAQTIRAVRKGLQSLLGEACALRVEPSRQRRQTRAPMKIVPSPRQAGS